MTQVDPKKFSITPIDHADGTFHDLMAEQLRHAPWLVLSAAAHGIAILLLWILIPAEPQHKPRKHAEVVDTTQEQVQPPEKPKPIETRPEEVVIEPTLTEDPIIDEAETLDVADVTTETLSAFESNQWNTAVGMLGGAGGPYGDRGKGRGKGTGGGTYRPYMENALSWLARHQDADGKWDCDRFMKHDQDGEVCDGAGNAVHDVGITGLALLAVLGDNNTMRAGPYRENVKKGVQWLREQQQDNGLFGTVNSHDFIYDHTLAAYAMCEAYGLSNYRLLKPIAQNGINYLESHRSPYGVWRYQPRDLDGDTSITGWAIMAYKSGEFFGLDVSKTAMQLAATFLDQVSDATGRHGYQRAGEASSRKRGDHEARFPVDRGETLTAVALFCRFFMGQDPKEQPVMKRAADLIVSKPPVWDEASGAIDHYYWYYGTYAMFQVGGPQWTQWQKKLGPAVLKTQHNNPTQKNLKGSWDPVGAWGDDGGRVYSTAILALTLQAHDRYSRLLR